MDLGVISSVELLALDGKLDCWSRRGRSSEGLGLVNEWVGNTSEMGRIGEELLEGEVL